MEVNEVKVTFICENKNHVVTYKYDTNSFMSVEYLDESIGRKCLTFEDTEEFSYDVVQFLPENIDFGMYSSCLENNIFDMLLQARPETLDREGVLINTEPSKITKWNNSTFDASGNDIVFTLSDGTIQRLI